MTDDEYDSRDSRVWCRHGVEVCCFPCDIECKRCGETCSKHCDFDYPLKCLGFEE